MTLNMIQSMADSTGITMDVDGENIVLEGSADQVDELATMIRPWKPELIQVLSGETTNAVGQCHCGCSLLGLPTWDGYVNRVCPDCGRWFRCLDPDLIELLEKRIAIAEHEGQADQAESEKIAYQWLESAILEKRPSRIDANARMDVQATIEAL